MLHLTNGPHNLRCVVECYRLVHPGEAKALENFSMFFGPSYHTANKFYLDLLSHITASSKFRGLSLVLRGYALISSTVLPRLLAICSGLRK